MNMALDGTTVILETQVIPKEELYKRWFGATEEEIAGHFNKGELHAYVRYKGPIKGILWCKPGHIEYGWHGFPDNGYYEYNDIGCDYFLLEDVMLCETEHPEYIGNVTPERLGLIQTDASKAPKNEPEYIPAEEVRKQLRMSPVQFVDMLNGQKGTRLVTSWEEWYRSDDYHVFETDKIEELTVHCFDLQEYLQERAQQLEEIPSRPLDGKIDFTAVLKPSYAELEAQLAEMQKSAERTSSSVGSYIAGLESRITKFEAEVATKDKDLADWKSECKELRKEFLAEREKHKQQTIEPTERQKALEEKDALIAELKKELAAAKAEPATTANAAKWESSVAAAFRLWADITQGDKADWKEKEFSAALVKLCADYHTKVLDLAWRTLPDAFKSGRGRPKKNPEKSQQSDNS